MLERVLGRWTEFLLQNRVLVATITTVIFVAAMVGGKDLVVDPSVEGFFGGGDRELERLEEYRAQWGADDDVLMVVIDGGGEEIVTAERLRVVREMGSALEEMEEVVGVESIATVMQQEAMMRSGPMGMMGMFGREVPPQEHPLWAPVFVSRDGQAGAMFVETVLRSDDIEEVIPMIARLRAVMAPYEGREGLHFGTAGIPAVRADFFEVFMADQMTFMPLGMMLITICLVLVFRSMTGILVPGVAAMIPVAMVYGMMGWTGVPVGLLNQSYMTLLPVIAVADAIHLLSRVYEESRRVGTPGAKLDGAQRHQVIVAAVQKVGGACLLTSLTTAIGFGSLLVAKMPVMRSFGVYAAGGVLVAYLTVLTALPLMLSVARIRVPKHGASARRALIPRITETLAVISIARPWITVAVTVVVTALCVWGGTKVVSDNHLTVMLKPEHPTTVANTLADEKLGGILGAEVDLIGRPAAFLDPKVLDALLALEDEALTLPNVRSVAGPASFIAGAHQLMGKGRTIPADRAQISAMFAMMEKTGNVERFMTDDAGRARMVIRSVDEGGIAFARFAQAVQDMMGRHLADVDIDARLTGTPFIAYRGINHVTDDLVSSLMFAFVAITIIIALLLRDIRLALLCLLPNALPLLAGYALVGFAGWLLDPAAAVVFTVALGIAVDDTLHLIARTREEMIGGLDLREAITRAATHTGKPIFITTVLLVGGFGVNMLSSFPATAMLGALGAVVVAAALVADLLVLPAMMVLFAKSSPMVKRAQDSASFLAVPERNTAS